MPTSPLVAYHSLTISLPFPHHSLTKLATRCEGAIRRLLVVQYHSLTISLPCPYHSLTTRLPNLQQDVREPFGDCWRFHTIPIRLPYHFLTIPLPLAYQICTILGLPPWSPDSQINPAWPENATGNIGDAPGHVASAATVSLLTCLLPPY